ncbi:MAG: DUF3102 domain-containing protein [Rubrivivax sp.]|nr:DUF3102 domain-containing protein [Rubrivivax sp.]
MPRKPSPTPEAPTDVLDNTALTGDAAALTELSARSKEVSERFGDGSPYERSRIVNEARFYMGQSAEAMLELGKRLIQLKENEPHGEFCEIVTERLGISPRSAQLMMAASVKYLSPALAAKAQTLSLLGKAKLFDLMSETDGDIAQLTAGGTLAGKTLDEIETMTSRQLKAALTDARKSLAAKDKVIQSKSAKVDKLEEELAGRDAAPLDEVEEQQLTDLRTATLDAETALQRVLVLVDDVMGMPATEATSVAARHSLDYLVQRVVDGCLARGITVDLADRVSPIWAKPLEDAAAANAEGRGKGRRK